MLWLKINLILLKGCELLLEQINLFLAFGAGFLSFLSPCALPLYPAFLSYLTGMTVNELKEEGGILRKKAFIHTILFLLGFSIIFLALGLTTSLDRKSTRLNSSHVAISYAVFCLKKKKNKNALN